MEWSYQFNAFDDVCDLKLPSAFICFAPALECARVLASLFTDLRRLKPSPNSAVVIENSYA